MARFPKKPSTPQTAVGLRILCVLDPNLQNQDKDGTLTLMEFHEALSGPPFYMKVGFDHSAVQNFLCLWMR